VCIWLPGVGNGRLEASSHPRQPDLVRITRSISFVEARVRAPMLPLELFNRGASRANLLTFFSLFGAWRFSFSLSARPDSGTEIFGDRDGSSRLAVHLADVLAFHAGQADCWPLWREASVDCGPAPRGGGFLLFAVASVNVNYWTRLFPAFIVLGLGMAISVAPLTTVVMNSVGEDRAGVASGINNAGGQSRRCACIAVLGTVIVCSFAHSLEFARGPELESRNCPST